MRIKLFTLIAMIFAVALYRWLPHPPNFSPVTAMALFGGAYFADKRMAFIVPFLALLLGDLLIGFHDTMVYVYTAFALTVGIGIWLGGRISATCVVVSSLASSVLFFVVTNFGAWLTTGLYAPGLDGLVQAYVAGIPFFQNTVFGNVVFSALMFGSYELMQRGVPALRKA